MALLYDARVAGVAARKGRPERSKGTRGRVAWLAFGTCVRHGASGSRSRPLALLLRSSIFR